MMMFDMYWTKDKKWLDIKPGYNTVPKEDAPKEVWDSYKHYLEQMAYVSSIHPEWEDDEFEEYTPEINW